MNFLMLVGWFLLLLGTALGFSEAWSYCVVYAGRSASGRKNLLRLKHQLSLIRADYAHQAKSECVPDLSQVARTFIVTKKIKESADISSLYFKPVDGKPLTSYLPGQYVVIEADIPGHEQSISRPYSLSDFPIPLDAYKITVKKEMPPKGEPSVPAGIMSTFLVDTLQEGDQLRVNVPTGNFCLDPQGENPIVMLASGVGITPFLSMLNASIHLQNHREMWLFYGTYDQQSQIMAPYFSDIQRQHPNVHIHICYSSRDDRFKQELLQNNSSDGVTYHLDRVNIRLVKKYLQSTHYECFICGSETMMTQMRENLENWGVPTAQIHTEKFHFNIDAAWNTKAPVAIPHDAVVNFSRSEKQANWHNSESTISILSLAEFSDVHISCSCRSGECGACRTRIKSGKVQHMIDCADLLKGDEFCLPCVAIPASKELVLDI